MARSTGKRITCCLGIGVRMDGECLLWNMAERSTWGMLAVTLMPMGPASSRQVLVQSLSHSFSFHINLPPQPGWMLLVPIATCCSCKATPVLCPVRRYPRSEWAGVRQGPLSLFPTLFLLVLPCPSYLFCCCSGGYPMSCDVL